MFLIIFGMLIGLGLIIAFELARKSNNKYKSEDKKIKRSKTFLFVLFIVPVLITTLFASLTKVGTGEIAVMTRFGRVTGQELGEGLHIKMPFDKANIYDIKVMKEETSAAAASKDLQDANATLVLNYSLEAGKVSEIHRTVGPLYKEKLIDPALQEVFKASTAQFDATQLITNRPAAKAVAFEQIRDRLKNYGIIVQDLSLTNFSFSTEFAKAIEAKQVAQQEAEKAKFVSQKAEEEARAEVIRATGSAEAQKLQQETLTPLLVQKQLIEKWDGKLPTVTGGNGNLLDIDSLIKARQ